MAKSRELYLENRRMAGPLTNWNYLKRTSGVFHSTYDEDFKPLNIDSARTSVRRSYAPVRFPQGSFSSCDYPTSAGQASRPLLLNTWHDREWAQDNKTSFEQSLIEPTLTFLEANPDYFSENSPACKTTLPQSNSVTVAHSNAIDKLQSQNTTSASRSVQLNTSKEVDKRTSNYYGKSNVPNFRY